MDNRLLATLRDSLIEGISGSREAERFGGFVYLRHPSSSIVWLNQTIPAGPCTAEDLGRLLERYRETEREPFFEFFTDLSPELPPMLEAGGMRLDKRMPVMVLARDQWRAESYGDLARIPNRGEYRAAIEAVNEAFGESVVTDDAELRLELAVRSGQSLVAVAFCGDHIVGYGQAVGTPQVREIAGIGTRLAFRRRGFARAVIQCLLDQFFSAKGEVAWLTPGDDGAESLYRGLVFEAMGTQVCYSASSR